MPYPLTDPLIRSLSRRDTLSQEEEDALEGTISHVEFYRAGQDIVAEDSRPSESCLMLTGFSARYHIVQSGKRQFSALHIPGDFVDLHSLLLKTVDHGVMALSDCKVARVPHPRLRDLTDRFPHLTRLLWLSTVVDAAIHRAWIVAMGRRSAVGQMAHLFCELFLRMQAVELTNGNSFHFPLTQAELGDLLGRSTVHVNRILQFLRRKELIAWRDSTVNIEDWERLRAVADFDPTYLSLRKEPR